LHHDVGPIAEELFKTKVQTSAMHNCPTTVDNIDNARKTFGKSMHALKCNCVRQPPKKAKNNVLIIPWEMVANNHKIESCMDGVTIDGMNFLHGTDKTVKCCHMTCMSRTQAEDHCEALDDALRKCDKARFVVTVIHCDREFKPLMDKVKDNPSVRMNCANPHKHKSMTQHANCTLKGRVQNSAVCCHVKMLPRQWQESWCYNHARSWAFFQQRMELVGHTVHNRLQIKKHWIVNAIANINLEVLCKAVMPKLHTTQQLKEQLIAFVWVQQKMIPREAMNC